MPKDRDAVFIHRLPVHSRGVVVSPLGVLKSLPGEFVSGLVILLFVHLRSSAMSMSGTLVQLGGSLMILEMRSVVNAWTFIDSLFRPTCYGTAWLTCKRDPNTLALSPNATLPW